MSRKPGAPPPSLTRPAAEAALRDVEQEINRWLFSYVQRWRCIDPAAYVGRVLPPMKEDEVRAFVASNFRELWDKVVPKRLKDEYAAVQDRLSAEPNPTVTSGGRAAKRRTGRPRAEEQDSATKVITALTKHHGYGED